jgi:hypothetical protein
MRPSWANLCVAATLAVLLALLAPSDSAAAPNKPPPAKPAKQAKDAKDAKKDEPVDPFVRGDAAFRAQRFGAAIAPLRDFIGASAGDARLPTAKAMLFDSYRGRAEKAVHDGDPCGAARGLGEGAEFYKAGDEADALRDQARVTLQSVFDAARAKDPELAADVAREYSRLFSGRPPLADEQEVHRLEVSALAQAYRKKAPPEYLFVKVAALRSAGVTPQMFADQKIDVDNIQVAYAEELINKRKWYSRAIEILRGLEENAPDEQPARRYQVLIAKALGLYAEACLSLGNHEMMEQAVLASEKYPGAVNTPGGRKLKTARAKAGGKEAKPLVLDGAQPYIGEGNLVDSGGGIAITDRVQIGREKTEQGSRNDGVITVPAGAVIDGGKIAVEKGKLLLKGQPDKPVVLRGVEISCYLGGAVVSENAVFIDCKFGKAGGWYVDSYSSQWTFNNCTLLRSNFQGLDRTNFGIKLLKCTLVECKFPERLLQHEKAEDIAARYQDEWNKVEDCDFLMCELRPSFVWTTDRCNFSFCKVTGADVFQSTTPLTVALYVPKLDGPFWRDLHTGTDWSMQGGVKYVNTGKEFARKGNSNLWPWVVGSKDILSSGTPIRAAAAQ